MFEVEKPFLRVFYSFPMEVKIRVNEEQDHECAMCHQRVRWMGPHHIVPENALKRKGIKGKNVRENAIGLCSGEGGGTDCHEVADQMAIRENKFWHNGRFVDLSELDPNTYIGNLREMPERRAKTHKIKERRHHKRR